MKIKINHITNYHYSDQVSIGFHKLYLFPQAQVFQKILSSQLTIHPKPVGQVTRVDLVGNVFAQVWFDEPTDQLIIGTDLVIDCQEINPFGFIIEPYFISNFHADQFHGFVYRDDSEVFIRPYIHQEFLLGFVDFINPLRINSSTFLDFLVKLTATIHQKWQHVVREEEDLWTPEKTFSIHKGSCRDLAWMQMNMLGGLGLATRFVSGYAFNPELASGHELHAWLEVFLPGAGWIGLDPSLGLLTNQLYIPLAFHADPRKTLPVQGSFAGAASAELATTVTISELAN